MIYHVLRGDSVLWLIEMHAKYGEFIRVGPDELSYNGSEAFREIHGHKKAGQATLMKDPALYTNPLAPVPSIINANDASHSRMRRIFSHAFSDRALKLQEPLFLVHINKLIQSLRSTIRSNPSHVFNMVNMYNFTTFDVMGDLTFGETLQLLDNDTYHPWLFNIFKTVKYAAVGIAVNYYPVMFKGLTAILPALMGNAFRKNEAFTNSRVDRRLQKQDARPDIWGLILARDEETGLSRDEMYSNAAIFMIAGTETTATLMSGLTYYLCTNPDKMKRLTDEIREEFADDSEITIERLQSLKYLNACVEEGLRMYPPVPNGLPRRTPPGGATINDEDLPADVCTRSS
jgi:cytochrome P450